MRSRCVASRSKTQPTGLPGHLRAALRGDPPDRRGGAVGLVRARLRTGPCRRIASDLGEAPQPGSLEPALGRAVGDPELRIAYWLPGSATVRRVVGAQLAEPVDRARAHGHPPRPGRPAGRGRLARPRRRRLERRWAPRCRWRSTTNGCRPRRSPSSRTCARPERASSRPATRERRRLERDLHDGAQQRLLGALLRPAARARRRASRAATTDAARLARRAVRAHAGRARRAARPRPRHLPGDPRPRPGSARRSRRSPTRRRCRSSSRASPERALPAGASRRPPTSSSPRRSRTRGRGATVPRGRRRAAMADAASSRRRRRRRSAATASCSARRPRRRARRHARASGT